jgi:hypothetical protein
MRSRKNGRAARSRKNGRAAADDIEAMFRAINGAPTALDAAAPDGEAGKAEVLAAVADGSIFNAGVDNLRRLGQAVGAGWLDDPTEVSDATRRKIIDHVAARLREGGPAEKVAAAQVMDGILLRPGVRARPEAAGAAPLHSEDNGDAPGADPRPPGGRTKRGRFAAGNRCARGNPAHRHAAALKAALGEGIGPDEVKALGKQLYQQALSGDTVACRLLLEHLIGRPRLAPDPDRLDIEEYAILTGGPSLSRLWIGANETVDAGFAAQIWRKLSASDPDAGIDQMLGAVQAEPQRFARELSAERKAKVGR